MQSGENVSQLGEEEEEEAVVVVVVMQEEEVVERFNQNLSESAAACTHTS